MAELAMLADIQRTVYSEEVARQLHVMAQGRDSLPVIDRRSNQLWYATNFNTVLQESYTAPVICTFYERTVDEYC